ncbi:PASTA domain-containing protein [Streptomyces sp. BH-SS-21]|uniref:PASTA domain-containing protein n=1 Tax=Streptomyces liliiviolaceus TaxID=2823109 RepID=A0A940Y1L2_9ACTN|nr:PASTA domain-containing protein [Streptomyces liliiviolaceus]MBQ0853981.1 PASTA domain-containing protein [Streptomyces liliiviolaceus]
MTIHACVLRTGKTVVRRLAVLLVAALILSGCTEQRLFAVRAVAAGIPSLAPFFEEDGSLGKDRKGLAPQEAHSGLQQGNTPGLYGGTRDQQVCDIERLKDFLTDPENRQKAREWARIVGITPDRIEEYLDDLTPVLLRHDTLVKNHDYKKGKAVPYDSLLEAGVAVLVNDQGLPAVKCSCGNPLKSFDKDPEKISVKFEDGNKKWAGYEKSAVVTVKPAPQPLKRIALLDVDDPDTAIERPVGTSGEQDSTFDATREHEVPAVVGMTFDRAGQELARLGLAVAYEGDELPPGDAAVTGSTPGAGTPLAFGEAVTLSVDADSDEPKSPSDGPRSPSDRSTSPSDKGTGSAPGKGTPSGKESEPGGGTSAGTGSTTPGGGTASSPAGTTPTVTESTPVEEPPPPPASSTSAPTVTSTPPTADPTSADPTSADPPSTGPTSMEPTLSEPASEPVASGPAPSGGSGTGEADQGPA